MQRLPLPVRNKVQWNPECFLSLLEWRPSSVHTKEQKRGAPVQDPTRHPLPTFPSDFAVILELGWGWEWQKSLTLCDSKPDFSFLLRRSSNPIDDRQRRSGEFCLVEKLQAWVVQASAFLPTISDEKRPLVGELLSPEGLRIRPQRD